MKVNDLDNPSWQFSIASTVEEVEQLRNFWEKECGHPNYDIDFFLAVINSRKEIVRPFVIILYENEQPKSGLVGRIEDIELRLSIGYKVLFKPKARSLTLVYPSIIGNDSAMYIKALFKELILTIKKNEVDIICLNSINVDSELYRLATSSLSFFNRDNFPETSLHWRGSLGASYDDFCKSKSKNTRHNLKRYSLLLEKNYPDRVRVENFNSVDKIDQFFKDTKRIADLTYQRGIGTGFDDTKEMRNLVKLSIEKGWFIGNIIYVDNNPCAFWNGIIYKNIFYTWTTGYNPGFSKDHPGMYALVKILQKVHEIKTARDIDFGFGDAKYKRDLVDQSWNEASMYIFPLKIKSIYLNIIIMIFKCISLAGSSFLKKTKLWDKVRKKWRNKLI